MILEDLSNEIGVSGDEGLIRKIIIPALKTYVDEITVDTMGNVFAYKAGQTQEEGFVPTVMVTAHMDEVGFMITNITRDGLLRFTTVGGFDPRIIPGKRVIVGRNKIPGVIGSEAVHNIPRSQRGQAPSLKSLAIDIGASKKEDAQSKVTLGDYVTFATTFNFLNQASDNGHNNSGIVKGKALDNRAGCAMLIEILKETHPVNIVGVFTVQEEIGTRGATVAAHRSNPDLAIVLECTTADDLPIEGQEIGHPRLGDGPCVTIMDRSFIAPPWLLQHLEQTATTQNIPYQYKHPGMGGTDAAAIHKSRTGVPTAVIAAPSRYIHSPAALMDMSDFWHCITLVNQSLKTLPTEKELFA
ncbi:MAG: M42 family metallopeptidase [Chloroflexota bacterium]